MLDRFADGSGSFFDTAHDAEMLVRLAPALSDVAQHANTSAKSGWGSKFFNWIDEAQPWRTKLARTIELNYRRARAFDEVHTAPPLRPTNAFSAADEFMYVIGITAATPAVHAQLAPAVSIAHCLDTTARGAARTGHELRPERGIVPAPAVESPVIASLPGREDEFKKSIDTALEYARVLGNKRLHVMAGLMQPGRTREEHRATYVKNLIWAAQQITGRDLILVIERINTRDIPGYFTNTTGQEVGNAADIKAALVRQVVIEAMPRADALGVDDRGRQSSQWRGQHARIHARCA